MKKILLLLLVLFISPMIAIAQQETLGTFKQNTCITLVQSCGNCTYSNVTSIILPSGKEVVLNTNMTKDGTKYTLGYCSTYYIGTYVVNGVSDVDSVSTSWAYDFDITPSGTEGGFTGTFGFYIILIGIIAGLILLGFGIKDGWFVVFGGLGAIALGIYSINSGIAGFRDMFMVWGIGLFEIGVGAYLAVNASLEMMND